VKAMVNPFAYEEYKKEKIRQKIEEARAQRVQIKKLPKVNKELALKLYEEEEELSQKKKKQKKMPNILSDDRFKVMFENPDFQVDQESEEYRLLNPLVSKISEKRKKKLKILEKLDAEDGWQGVLFQGSGTREIAEVASRGFFGDFPKSRCRVCHPTGDLHCRRWDGNWRQLGEISRPRTGSFVAGN
ncbi:predicted protein, partial [Nematostella vectensis]